MSNKFQVGDRVEFTVPEYVAKVGEKGTIRVIDPDFKNLLGVELDKNLGGHSLDGKCESGHGCWANSRQLRLIGRKFLPGQVYLVGNGMRESGNIIRVLDVYTNELGCEHCRYQTIRGNTPSSGHLDFGVDSPFSNALTLLTGKEIGEAIKKWDTDHAPKSEREYTEVKRPAKPGEYIKIVAAAGLSDDEYKNGDVLLVIKPDSAVVPETESGVAFYKNAMWKYASQHEYVVLEGYSPAPQVNEVKRRAEVGEYVKITKQDAGYFSVGDVLRVLKFDGLRLPIVRCNSGATRTIMSDEYVVLEGYQPENPTGNIRVAGKHIYTADQVAEAKRIALDIIREYAEKVSYVLFNKSEDSKEVTAFVTNSESRLGAVPGADVLSVIGFATGVAKCSPNDEPNLWIGKCVALCKALRKPVPRFIMENGAEKRFSFEKAQRLCDDGDVVTIRCKDEAEGDALKAELEKLGVLWRGGGKPTEKDYFGNDYFVVENGKVLSFNKMNGHDKSVEFSDCFTEN